MHERGVAGGGGELPEQRLRRGAVLAGRELELTGQGRVLPRDLVAAGRRQHVLAHRDHHRGDVLAGRVEVPEQRLGEEAVPPEAVVGDVVGLGREGEEEARGVAYPGEPVALRGERWRRGGERVGAAGVEEDEVDPRRAFELVADVVEPDGPVLDVGPAPEARVHRDEEVPAVDLEAVAGVVEERSVGGLRAPRGTCR